MTHKSGPQGWKKNLLGVGEKTTRKKNYNQMTTLTLTSPQLNY
jgi:hypothetical protein